MLSNLRVLMLPRSDPAVAMMDAVHALGTLGLVMFMYGLLLGRAVVDALLSPKPRLKRD